MKLIQIFVGLLLLVLPLGLWAALDSVTVNTGTLRVTVDGIAVDLTVTSGLAESIEVRGAELAVGLAAGSSISFSSSDRKSFTYEKTSASATLNCGDSTSVLTISLGSGLSSETVIVRPQSGTCVVQGTGGSGGGGSPSSTPSTTTTTTTTSTPSPTTTTTTTSAPSAATPSTTTTTSSTQTTTITTAAPATPLVVATTPSAPAVSAPVSVVSMAPVLMKEINPGARSDEVMKLQELLAQDSEIYPDGIVSGYYGPKTTAAVRKFQQKYGLPAVGRVGPATLAKINEVFGEATTVAQPSTPSVQSQTANQIQSQIQAIQQQIQSITSGAVSTPSAPVGGFTTALSLGARNESVRSLQEVLNSDSDTQVSASGPGSAGSETNYFGPATHAAVQRFQVKHGIAGPGDPGYGFVGPATRAKLNDLTGGVSSVPAPLYTAPVAPTTPTSSSDTAKQIEDQIKAIQAQIDALLKK